MVTYQPVLSIRPLAGDNLYVLGWAHSVPFRAIWLVDPALYPEWRPLPYLTIWIEHAFFGLEWVRGHFIVNIGLWVVCSFLVYKLVLSLTADRIAAMLAATWLLFDRRAISALSWIVERQTSLACGFGLLALLLIVSAKNNINPLRAVAIGTSLVAAALSKEYGLAFAPAIFCWGIWTKSRVTKAIPLIAVLTYAILRSQTAGFETHGYCEEMGFFDVMQERCFGAWSPQVIEQASYNVAASVVGTIVPGVVNEDGMLYQDRWRLLRSLGLLTLALAGLRYGGTPLQALAVLIASNGILSFMLYRERNVLIGVCAVAVALGVGIAMLPRHVNRQWFMPALRITIILFFGFVLWCRRAEAVVQSQKARLDYSGLDGCISPLQSDSFSAGFAPVLNNHYGIGHERCLTSSDPTPFP